jgi:hypothetical protein
MPSQRNVAEVGVIMTDFAHRTGLLSRDVRPQRYLWTDAFALCNFLSLFGATRDDEYLRLATLLIDQVHETLGRHRLDAAHVGWISGLDEREGQRHPTIGGLRIGKALAERGESEPYDERREWDRDGQYFHYLTKWMHALERAAVVTANPTYCRWALELAQSAHAAFTYRTAHAGELRMYWKMSVELSRPAVPSMGHHDPLDAFVTYQELAHCRRVHFLTHPMPDLAVQTQEAAQMCRGRSWATEDPLSLGGLLADACRIGQLRKLNRLEPTTLLEQVLTDAGAGLQAFISHYPLRGPEDQRLAFREFGLSIGLHAIAALRALEGHDQHTVQKALGDQLAFILPFTPLAEQIESFWRRSASQSAVTWRDHLDINTVMLATSLLPEHFLRV